MKVPALIALGLLACGAARAAPAASFPAPDRQVAEIVSPIWSSERNRDDADETGQLTRLLGIQAGMAVADIGAGSGYETLRLSRVVGPRGRVFAEDVTESYLAGLRQEIARRRLTNIQVVLGGPADAGLAPNSVDRAILVHMYHEVAQPYALIWNLADALKAGAKVGVEDLDRPTEQHGTPPALLRCEFEAVGYRQTGFTVLEGGIGYLAVFAPPKPGARPEPGAIRPCRAPRAAGGR